MSLAAAVQPLISNSQPKSPLVPPSFDVAGAIARRKRDWWADYAPRDGEESWLFEQMVYNSVQVDLCQHELSAAKEYVTQRAVHSWDNDRRLAAEEIARGLAKKPGRTVARLLATKQGCEWLIERWRTLGRIAEQGDEADWTDSRIRTAFELNGVPEDERFGTPWAASVSAKHFVAGKIADLEGRRDGALDALDRDERDAAIRGHEVTPSKVLNAIRRREAACLKRMQSARSELMSRRAAPPAPSEPQPSDASPPEPVATSKPAGIPVFGPEAPSLAEAFAAGSATTPMNRKQRRAAQKRAGARR